jgi:hypothetical protein
VFYCMKLSIQVIELDREYIANCPELEINCYGADRNDAIRRIQNVLQFYISSAQELGFDVENFDSMIIDGGATCSFAKKQMQQTPESIH